MTRARAFTLTEVLVSVSVLAVLVLLVGRLSVSTAQVTTSGNSRMETDAQVRPLFERLAVDLAQMIKRSDVDFFGKGTVAPNSAGGAMAGNDQLAFFSSVPGYHSSGTSPGPISLVAYRVGANKLERLAKALIWNGDTGSGLPMVFLPLTIASTWPGAIELGATAIADPDSEVIAPYIFRLEYHYILRNGALSITPRDSAPGHGGSGVQDVAAIAIAIAAIDPKSRRLISEDYLATMAGTMNDFSTSMNSGDLLAQWQSAIDATTGLPRASLAGIRLHERTFHLSPKP